MGEEGKDEALEGAVEHEVADGLIEDLKKNPSTQSDEWSARCGVLQELLEHHIEEEEDEMFKSARKLFDAKALDRMGEEFLTEKARLGIDTKEFGGSLTTAPLGQMGHDLMMARCSNKRAQGTICFGARYIC